MLYNSNQNRKDYYPPILGNGDIAFSVDCEGALNYVAEDFGGEGVKRTLSDGCIVRAGRRINRAFNTEAELLPFGRFVCETDENPLGFSQELDINNAKVISTADYPSGQSTKTVSVIHPKRNIYAMKKTVSTDSVVTVSYCLEGYDRFTVDAIRNVNINSSGNGFEVEYFMIGSERINGKLRMFADRTVNIVSDGNCAKMSCSMKSGESVCLFLLIEDSLDGDYETFK